MSHHSGRALPLKPRVGHPLLYMLAMKVCRGNARRPDTLAGKLFVQISSTVCLKRPCTPGRRSLGAMHGRSVRSIARALRALVDAGLVERRRRGKQLTNVYRLAKWIWARITGQDQWAARRAAQDGPAQLELASVIERARGAWAAARARGAPLPA